MRFSRFVNVYECIFEDECFYIIRHSITNKSYILNNKEFNELIFSLKNKKTNDSVVQLKKEHLLVPDSYSEDKFIDYLKKSYNLNKFDLEIIYLLFNTGCNLKCKYCYVEGSSEPNFKNHLMDKQTFYSLIKYLDNLISFEKNKNPKKRELTFIYYGSEPLMTKNYFIESLDKIKKICDKNKIVPDFQITTNGTLIDEEVVKAIKKYHVGVSISLDGEKEVNDKMRITQNNKGTYDKIISGLDLLKKSKIPFGISCTISDHNINKLKNSANHFIQLGASSVGFNILLNPRYTKISLNSLPELNDSLIEASREVQKRGFYEDRVQRKIRAFNGLPRFKDCGGVGNQLVFFPNGDIGPCEAYLCNRKSIIGNINFIKVEEIEKSPIIKYWTERYPLNMEECLYCSALGICGGGCPFNAETLSKKDIYQRDKPFCAHTEIIFNWLLKKSVEEKTGKKNPFIRNITFMYSNKIF